MSLVRFAQTNHIDEWSSAGENFECWNAPVHGEIDARAAAKAAGKKEKKLRGARMTRVRKTPSWPRSWASSSILWLHSHRSAGAISHILDQPNPFLASLAGGRSGAQSEHEAGPDRCIGGATGQSGELQGEARRLQRAEELGRGPTARSLGQPPASVQEEAGPRRSIWGDDGGAGGEAGGARLRLGAVPEMRV